MIIISEYELTKEQIDKYHARGYRVVYGNQDFTIKKGESVGILMKTIYKSTIDLIERLLDGDRLYQEDNNTHFINTKHVFRHKITIKYKDKTYRLSTMEDWKETTQKDNDMLKLETYRHPILKMYLANREDFFIAKEKADMEDFYDNFISKYNITELPNEDDVNKLLETFAPLYQIDIDADKYNRINQYYQIQWYLDNDIPYVNEVKGINPKDELMFENIEFKINNTGFEIESFGDETYFEDECYQNLDNTLYDPCLN